MIWKWKFGNVTFYEHLSKKFHCACLRTRLLSWWWSEWEDTVFHNNKEPLGLWGWCSWETHVFVQGTDNFFFSSYPSKPQYPRSQCSIKNWSLCRSTQIFQKYRSHVIILGTRVNIQTTWHPGYVHSWPKVIIIIWAWDDLCLIHYFSGFIVKYFMTGIIVIFFYLAYFVYEWAFYVF